MTESDRRGRGRPKGGRRVSDPINDLASHPAHHFDVAQLAAYWGIHVNTVTSFIRHGMLTATRIGGKYRIAKADALTFERLGRRHSTQ